MEWKNKKVLVVGSGISGIGAATLLNSVGALPILFDENKTLTIESIKEKFEKDVEIQVVLGELPGSIEDEIDLVVLSPGVPTDIELVNHLRKKGLKIWGEIELGYAFERGKVAAITGTNGKTTTTTLVGQMVENYFGKVFIVGNIGNPYTLTTLQTTENTVTVAEISSFQLETIEHFSPTVSAILNITPDHLNRHHTMEKYIEAKETIAINQTRNEVCVLNYDNEYTRDFGNRCNAKVIFFSSKSHLENGYYLEKEDIWRAKDGNAVKIINIHDIKLVGICNYENVMAALAMGESLGIPMESLISTVCAFHAVEHRIEFVATKKGVDYYNDSKGTNPDAAIQGILAMTKPTLLIGGGYDKQSTYDEWIEAFGTKVKCLFLIGQTKEKIAVCAREHGFTNIIMAESLEEVMKLCEEMATPGDAVLLSPACASWGMFPNYEVRGRIFKNIVNDIKE